MKKTLCLTLVLALCLSLTAAFSAFAEEKKDVVLTAMFWSGDSSSEATKKAVEAFNALDNGITINVEWLNSEDTKTKLPTLMAANNAPDLFMAWAAGYLKPYVDAGKVYSLSDALAADPEWANGFLGGILEHTTYDGQVYALPTSLSAQVCFYNKEIFDKYGLEIPQTQEDLVKDLKVIRDAGDGIIPLAFGNSTSWPSGSHSETLANRIGGNDPFAKAASGEGSWTDPSFVKAAQLLQDLANEKLVPDGFAALTPDEAIELFNSGKAAAINWSSYCMGRFDADGSAVKGKVVLAKCPTVEGGTGDPNMWLGQPDRNIAISERCEHKDEAVQALKFLTSVQAMQMMTDSGTLVPIKSTLLDMSKVSNCQGQLMNLMNDMTGMYLFYDVVLGSVTGNEYNNTVSSVMSGADATEAFQKFQNFFDLNAD
jgi:raffinose/stachyose/melibiose transport system substrate-binding protein